MNGCARKTVSISSSTDRDDPMDESYGFSLMVEELRALVASVFHPPIPGSPGANACHCSLSELPAPRRATAPRNQQGRARGLLSMRRVSPRVERTEARYLRQAT